MLPLYESVDIIATDYNFEPYIVDLTEHAVKNTYFIYNGIKYRQTDGASMGSPVSPSLATWFMNSLEKRAVATNHLKPNRWLRFIDDILLFWQHGDEELQDFFLRLNSVNDRIKFTMEQEQNGSLPFLDILINKNSNIKIGHTVYRKPTHTNRYLHANSHHHPSQLNGILKTLKVRSMGLTDEENRDRNEYP
ncbi:uncharacterized protein LOC123670569 [Harmonia axyridis]|uniref:uncharacterized protein LOC123670569 n=1 Tax=Harmonia axyridis TaxID=115357 RepID=UPI001E2765D4|nr:uncharacterized protein LOC123670569 [Harmonia axyridis]